MSVGAAADGSLCRSLGRPRTADGVPVNNIDYSGRANQEILRATLFDIREWDER